MIHIFRFAAVVLVALCLLTPPASAKNARAVRKTVEHSLQLMGTIAVNAQGRVDEVTLDEPERIPAGVAAFVLDQVPRWEFQPPLDDNGEAVATRAPMSLRVVARQVEDGGHVVSIRGASFQDYDENDPTSVASVHRVVPVYPKDVVRMRVEGDVYMAVKIGRDGQVEDVAVRQVNLHVVGSERSMDRMRAMLASPSIKAMKQWTYRVPSQGPLAERPYWDVIIPIEFRLATVGESIPERDPLQWTAYVPGPVNPIPWRAPASDNLQSPDALRADGVYTESKNQLRLLTRLGDN